VEPSGANVSESLPARSHHLNVSQPPGDVTSPNQSTASAVRSFASVRDG
jgi:hypothetical protein